jgi:hypothetical protein
MKYSINIYSITLVWYKINEEQKKRIIKYSRDTSRANWLSSKKTNISRTFSVPIFRVLILYPEDEERDGP